MQKHVTHSESEHTGCKNCGNCAKGGCGSIAAGLELQGYPAGADHVSRTHSSPAKADRFFLAE